MKRKIFKALLAIICAILVLMALSSWASSQAHAATVRNYIGHPKLVARVEQRRQERALSAPSAYGPGTSVSVICTRTRNRLRDNCQETIDPANSEQGLWRQGTAHISPNGHHFYVKWDAQSDAATAIPTAKSAVVYGTDGYNGFNHPLTRPLSFSIEQGTVKFRRIAWRKWADTATTKRAQEQDCNSNNCTPWGKVSLKFYSMSYRVIKNPNVSGGKMRLGYYTHLKDSFGGESICYAFSKDGSKVPEWHQIDIHGGC